MTRAQAYSFIAKVLSQKSDPGFGLTISFPPPDNKQAWQMVVKTASDNLVLPAFYHIIHQKRLLHLLPDDLAGWISNIYQLNLERNTKILSESLAVNQLLVQNQLPCIFMKGVANLLDGLYDGAGERMVYDIDILVGQDQMISAAKILESNGYYPIKRFNAKSLASTMHYPLLVREGSVAGVEIHRMPTQYHYMKTISNDEIFNESMVVKMDIECRIMGIRHRIIHNFIHTQLMHNGHNHANIALRDLYDLWLLGHSYPVSQAFDSLLYYRRHASAYLDLMHNVFGEDKSRGHKLPFHGISLRWRHRRVLRMSDSIRRFYHSLFLVLQKYFILPVRILWSPVARNYVFSRLLDRQWYALHYKGMTKIIFKK